MDTMFPVTTEDGALDARKLLVKGGLGVFAMRICALGLAFGAETLITRTLGLQEYDLWATAASWLAVLTVVAGLGMNTALVRHLAADQAHGHFDKMRGMIRWTYRRMVASGLIIGFSFWVTRHLIADDRASLARVLAVVALMLPIQALNLHRQAVLTGLKRPVLALAPDQLVRVGVLVIAVYLFSLSDEGLSATGLAWLWLVSIAAAFVAGEWWKWRCMPIQVRQIRPEYNPITWISTARPLLWLHLGGMLINQADPAMLGALAEPGQAGLFSVANRIALLLTLGLAAVNAIAAPLISQLHSIGEKAQLQAMLKLSAKWIALFTLPSATFVVLAGPWLLSLFGSEFAAAYRPLCWLVAGQSINALAGSVAVILSMTGHQTVASRIIWVAVIGKLVLNFLLMPTFGALGAAIGSAIILAFLSVWLWIEVRRRLDLEPTILSTLLRKYP